MLAAFFETFVITFGIFILAELALRLVRFGKSSDELDNEQELVEKFQEAIILCKVEKMKDVFYFYNAQDDNFVGQARSLHDVIEISERLQKHLMVVDGTEEDIVELKKVTNEDSSSQ